MRATTVSGRLSRTALAGSTMLMGLMLSGGIALAQDNPAPAAAPVGETSAQPLGAPAAGAAGTAVSEVVVTGSRIPRRDFTAPSPIVTVTQQAFENRSQVSLEATLNKLPQFNPGQTQFGGDQQPSATNTVGISTVNLRGLGANRTLVLLDGRRAQPANAALVIDLNTIPTSAIEGVEIITGGASAVYGADAVAGVVNFKLRKNFQGLELDGQWGKTEAGDGAEAQASMLIGGNFADNKGNAMVGLSWAQRAAAYVSNRDYQNRVFNDPNSPGFSTTPFLGYAQLSTFDFNTGLIYPVSQAAVDAVFATKGFAPGTIPASSTFAVNPDGTLFVPGPVGGLSAPGYTDTSNPGYKIVQAGSEKGNLEEVDRFAEVSTPLTRYSVFSNAHYDISDHITAFVQGMYTKSEFKGNFFNSPAVQFWGVSVPRDATHPVPAQLATLLDSRGLFPGPGGTTAVIDTTGQSPGGITFADPHTAPWALWQDTFAGRREQIDTSDNSQLLLGFRGDVPGKDWTWEVYGSRGETSQTVDFNKGWVSKQKLQAVISSPFYGRGQTFGPTDITPGAPATPGFSGTCTSGLYDTIFSGGQIAPSQDCIDLISVRMHSFTDLKQNNVEADIAGTLFNIWAGPVGFALGASYRENIFEYLPDPNLDQQSIVQTVVGLFGSNESLGKTDAAELYGELRVPLLSGSPFAKKLELELGARYSDYNWSGGNPSSKGGTDAWTYKLLANWDLNDWVTFRGGYQQATRAPNVAELFSGAAQTVVTAPGSGDPCSSTFNQSSYGVGPTNSNAANKAQAAKLCHFLIDPVIAPPGYDPATYVGLFGGNFPLDIAIFQGNPHLNSEVAKTWTLGTVLRSPVQSPWLQRTTLSVDYYNVAIHGGIATVLPQLSYQQCFNADGVSNPAFANAGATGAELAAGSPYCSFLLREPGTGFNRAADAPYVNLGGIKTSGVDIQLDWALDFQDAGIGVPGTFAVNFVMNWLQKYAYQASPTGPYQDYTGTDGNGTTGGPQYKYRTFTTFTYSGGPATIGLRWQHLPSITTSDHVTNPASVLVGAASYDLFDLFASYKVSEGYEIRAGVDNLFDKDPPPDGSDPTLSPSVRNANSGAFLSNYDLLGRRYYVGVRARF